MGLSLKKRAPAHLAVCIAPFKNQNRVTPASRWHGPLLFSISSDLQLNGHPHGNKSASARTPVSPRIHPTADPKVGGFDLAGGYRARESHWLQGAAETFLAEEVESKSGPDQPGGCSWRSLCSSAPASRGETSGTGEAKKMEEGRQRELNVLLWAHRPRGLPTLRIPSPACEHTQSPRC